MWKVFRGDAEGTNLQPVEVAQAQEVFGAICVDEASAKTIFGKAVIFVKGNQNALRGDLGKGPLYDIADLVRFNDGGKCSVDRPSRTYTLPAVVPVEQSETEQ